MPYPNLVLLMIFEHNIQVMVDSKCSYTELQGLALAQLAENFEHSLIYSFFLHNFTGVDTLSCTN